MRRNTNINTTTTTLIIFGLGLILFGWYAKEVNIIYLGSGSMLIGLLFDA